MSNRLNFLIAVVVAVSVLHAQNPEPPQQQGPQPPTFRAEANYVRVDVYPTANGVPVTDLHQEEFEILDNGIPQKIEQFEHVRIRAAGPQDTRIEPNTVRESRAMLEDSRARVFVLFLDTYHVDVSGSHDIRAPLVKMLDQTIGQNDLVGVMLPGMAATDITFARKTTTIDGFLSRYWTWGDRDQLNPSDDADKQRFEQCYPDGPIAAQLLDRLREKRTLDALGDLVVYLRGLREERKAIITISDGWRLFTPNETLKRPINDEVPGRPEIGVDPRTGKLSRQSTPGMASLYDCDRDRMRLADIDDALEFRELLDKANGANASFYTMDPRGLVVFDSPIGPEPPPPPSVDQAILRRRQDALRTLADATDGLAMLNSNALDAQLKRISDDLTSYYLLGYYTTAPLDGKFHKITVRVKRPGVQVRARRGYLAPTREELTRTSAPATSSSAVAKAAAETHAIESVIAPLNQYDRELPLRLHAWSMPSKIWIAGELGTSEARKWQTGGAVDLLLVDGTGETVGTQHLTLAAGARTFEVAIPAPAAGDYDVKVRARGSMDGAAPVNEDMKISARESTSGARFVRRGPSTVNRDVPAANLRFRRADTIRVEWPGGGPGAEAHLLDRTGKRLAIPVATATHETDGITWQTAQLALAPLAPGDYIIELVAGSERRLAAFRVIP